MRRSGGRCTCCGASGRWRSTRRRGSWLDRWAAALAAVAAPLLHSVPGVGYEQHAYVWLGYGVWTQLWGSWALPFAWALTWRALADKRFLAPAAALVALTAAFHFETGYLAH